MYARLLGPVISKILNEEKNAEEDMKFRYSVL